MPQESGTDRAYRTALLDWLACAAKGRDEPAARAARALGDGQNERVIAAATAGHVLDFDDTYLPGLAHLSAPTAPVALVLGAELGATVGDAMSAFAAGFEAMGALAAANHPDAYERGWHPTAVFGVVGAAVTAARLLGLGEAQEAASVRLSLLRAAGLRSAFGSDGKSLQVGMAAAEGVLSARLSQAGAAAPPAVISMPGGFEAVYGARWAEPGPQRAIRDNWIKAYPCCLQTHSAIEAAALARVDGAPGSGERFTVTVHPVSLQAAALVDVSNGLQAKFSIPYLVAYTLLHGPPAVDNFKGVDAAARSLALSVDVKSDARLLESEGVLGLGDGRSFRVEAALGSPARPMSQDQLAAKVRALAGRTLDAVLDHPEWPIRSALAAASL